MEGLFQGASVDDPINVTLHPPWREAVELFQKAGFKYGELLSHEWLHAALGLEMPRDGMTVKQIDAARVSYLNQVERFRRCLLCEHKIDIASKRGLGYVLVKPEDQTGLANKDGGRALRKTLWAWCERLVNVNLSLLTAEQRAQNAQALCNAANLARAALGNNRLDRLLGSDEQGP
jgi:hypothetical protein